MSVLKRWRSRRKLSGLFSADVDVDVNAEGGMSMFVLDN